LNYAAKRMTGHTILLVCYFISDHFYGKQV
jgi:hypothetical protein